ncbi:MAG: aldehyde dehydrogenase family protein [Acidobacteriota bacterium]
MLATLREFAHQFVHTPQLHCIGGNFVPSRSGAVQEVFDPSTGAVLTSVAMGSDHEVNLAVAAAQASFPAWSRTPPVERAVILHRVADALERHKDDLVQVESLDVGKAITATEGFDIPFGIACLRYFADLVRRF